MVLREAYFLFGHDFYLRNIGFAMGVAFAHDFASLFPGMAEGRYIYSNNAFSDHILFYKRYIDDYLLL